MVLGLSALPSTGVHLAIVSGLHGNSRYTTVATFVIVYDYPALS